MGKTKKPFIDKKKASSYHLLYRSQRDIAGADDENNGGNAGVILWPSPFNNRETDEQVLLGKKGENINVTQIKDDTLSEWKNQLSEAGLVDNFQFEKHTKPITGEGQYYASNAANMSGSSKKKVNAMLDARALDLKDEIVQEVDRQLDSIALTSDCMDDEIAQMLFGDFEEGEFEELNDEFVLDAAREPEVATNGEQAFDFAAHVRGLIERTKMESDGATGIGDLATIHEQGLQDQAFFAKAKRKDNNHDENDDDSGYTDEKNYRLETDETPGIVPKLTLIEEQALCDKFNEALAEYDSDELGELQNTYDDVIGDRPLEGDAQVEAALDDYLQEREDDIFMQGHCHYMDRQKNGGSGFSALVGTRMVPVKDIVEASNTEKDDTIRPISELLGEADDTLRNPHESPPTEEIFIDGKSYFSEKIRNPWDCESILSTYSNLDNNPTTIVTSGRRRRRRSNTGKYGSGDDESTASAQQIIKLSEKTGLPLGVLPSGRGGVYTDDSYCQTIDQADTYMSVNKGEKRHKHESAEEKKQRKLNVKKERQIARMQKKMMKNAFNDEFNKRQQDLLVDDMGGTSVFRF